MSDAPITPEFQTKAPQIMRYIMSVITPRLSDEDAAAILGSFGVETGGFTIREEVGGGGGYGWAQWTGDRRDDMEIWCAANGYDPYADSETEYDRACCAFFIHEITETWESRVLTEGGTISGVFYPPLCDCSTLDQKTLSFWKLFERPGTPHEDWRREMAHEALRLYRGGEGEKYMPYDRIVISSGHSLKVRGASDILDEVTEARRVTEQLATELRARGVEVITFHDDVSTSQNENLNRIVDYHNSQTRDLDVSVHFNAYVETSDPMGTECLYVSQQALSSQISAAIASTGFIDRGAKKRSDLFFLNSTEMPAILIEVCFVDSEADADLYGEQFEALCSQMANVLGGEKEETAPPPEGERPPIDRPERPPRPPSLRPPPPLRNIVSRVDIEVSGPVIVTVNRVPIET